MNRNWHIGFHRPRFLRLLAWSALFFQIATSSVRGAEQSYEQWYAELNATNRVYVESLARSIKRNVPSAKPIDARKATYGDPEARATLSERAASAVRSGDDRAAIEAWVELFKINNANFAQTAGYEATPDVMREVAKFFMPINRARRDETTPGSPEHRLLDTIVRATQRLIDAK